MAKSGTLEEDSGPVRLLYIGDPMCSWCWGFAPVLEALARRGWPIDVIVGGLRPGRAAEPLDDRLRRFLREEWTRIAGVTGQPFEFAALDRDGWLYDTEPAARAVVAMRATHPSLTLPWFTRIQRAFYAEAVDVTDPAVFGGLAADVGADVDAFARRMAGPASRAEARTDFASARQLGVTGFPTLLAGDGRRLLRLTAGYCPLDRLEAPLELAMQRLGPRASG